MTPITNATNAAKTASTTSTKPAAMTKDEVKQMLLDAAFVLHMTRRVKSEILANQANPAKITVRRHQEVVTGLGV